MMLTEVIPAVSIIAVAIAVIATATDLYVQRIPNWLTIGGVILILIAQGASAGWTGLASGIAGMITGLLLLLPFYVKGGMAAGDVKLLAAVGAGAGWPAAIVAGGATLVWGMVLGFAVLAMRGGLMEWIQRYCRIATLSLASRRISYEPVAPDSVAARPFPYALAILFGLLSAFALQTRGVL